MRGLLDGIKHRLTGVSGGRGVESVVFRGQSQGTQRMSLAYDPLTASLKYTTRSEPSSPGSFGGTFGTLWVNEHAAFETWEICASEEDFELDPCSCGVVGCGGYEARAHRAGPFVVWTAWGRRDDEATAFGHFPLVFRREALEGILGGDTHTLPELDGAHAWRLLAAEDAQSLCGGSPSDTWRWEGDAPYGWDAAGMGQALQGLTPSALEGASLHASPGAVWVLTWGGCSLDVCVFDEAIALRGGPLRRFGLFLRVPALVGRGVRALVG